MSDEKKTKKRWFPLESNPTLMNDYIQKLGFNTDLYEFVDVFSHEDWALAMIPQPVAAVMLLYPLTDKQTSVEDPPDSVVNVVDNTDNKIWFTKQRIGNACGTIGLLHASLNAPEPLNQFAPDSWLQKFQADTPVTMDPVKKAEILEDDDAIVTLHDKATSSEQNQTDRGELDQDLITHFIALVCGPDNILYELDGRKKGPIRHGPTSPATLLQDACKLVKTFMERDPEELRFNIMALAPKQS